MSISVRQLSAKTRTNLTVLAAALGCFVDLFDLQLFPVLRVSSLQSLNLSPEEITSAGISILNWQMAGMILGGLLWGILGDRVGRIKVLFFSILLYSLSSLANAFVSSVPEYIFIRFLTGIGLAGEVGVGVTLITELLPVKQRAAGVSIVFCFGMFGVIAAGFVGQNMNWQNAYILGGIMGLTLLAFRISVVESSLLQAIAQQKHIPRGRFPLILKTPRLLKIFLSCVMLGFPLYLLVGVIFVFTPEIGRALGITETLLTSKAGIWGASGQLAGNIASGMLTNILRSRKRLIACFVGATALVNLALLSLPNMTATHYYMLILIDGFFVGYVTVLLTTVTELFGTNLRATATTAVHNFFRASLIPMTLFITLLKPSLGLIASVLACMGVVYALAAFALWYLPESFGRNLDFVDGEKASGKGHPAP